jgi:hypothetical protein
LIGVVVEDDELLDDTQPSPAMHLLYLILDHAATPLRRRSRRIAEVTLQSSTSSPHTTSRCASTPKLNHPYSPPHPHFHDLRSNLKRRGTCITAPPHPVIVAMRLDVMCIVAGAHLSLNMRLQPRPERASAAWAEGMSPTHRWRENSAFTENAAEKDSMCGVLGRRVSGG